MYIIFVRLVLVLVSIADIQFRGGILLPHACLTSVQVQGWETEDTYAELDWSVLPHVVQVVTTFTDELCS